MSVFFLSFHDAGKLACAVPAVNPQSAAVGILKPLWSSAPEIIA